MSGELDKSAETSATVAGWKTDSSGGLEAGCRCGEEVVVPDRIEDRSLFIYLFILSFRNHSVITIIWHEMYSLKLNVRRCQQLSLLSRPL